MNATSIISSVQGAAFNVRTWEFRTSTSNDQKSKAESVSVFCTRESPRRRERSQGANCLYL